ncbi:MAG: hypothetical protein E7080_02415 [Bacteroidales bacterium]|nr:hypothetical protein [Bacteroidales bacterium]
MKTYLNKMFSTLLIVSAILSISCDDKALGNSSPQFLLGDFSFTIKVVDENSENLLIDDDSRNKIAENITITYNGKTYFCDYIIDFRNEIPTLPDDYFGMYMTFMESQENKEASYADITFGHFLSGKFYNNETFTINWGDGSSDTVRFTHGCYYIKDNKRVEQKEFYLNDKKYSTPTFVITKNI